MVRIARLAGIIILLISPITAVWAETLYVSEIRELSIRSGPGSDYKISSFVSTGQPLTVLETSGDWTRIQTGQGKEGWILTRFLKKDPPSQMAVYELERKNQQISTDKANIVSENEQLKAKNKAMEAELAAAKEAGSRLETNYEKLKKDSTEVLALKAQAKDAVEALEKEKARADKFENDFSLLNYEQRIKWFLSGAGVLLLGFIIGFISKSSRRRSSWK